MLSAHLPWQTMKKMSEAHKIPDANARKTAAQGLDKSLHSLLGNEAYKQYRTEAAAKHQAASAKHKGTETAAPSQQQPATAPPAAAAPAPKPPKMKKSKSSTSSAPQASAPAPPRAFGESIGG